MKKVGILSLLIVTGLGLLFFYYPKINPFSKKPLPTQTIEPQNFNFILPVNVADGKINLSVFIENRFKSIQDPFTFSSGQSLIEFIPHAEKPNNWSEIITLKPHLNMGVKAAQILNSIIQNMKPATTALTLIEQQDKAHEGYQDGYRLLTYEHNNNKEILYLYTASGPYDAITVQYAIRIKEGDTLENLSKKIKSFFEKNVKIVR